MKLWYIYCVSISKHLLLLLTLFIGKPYEILFNHKLLLNVFYIQPVHARLGSAKWEKQLHWQSHYNVFLSLVENRGNHFYVPCWV